MLPRTRLLRWALTLVTACALAGPVSSAFATPPIWETNFGSPINTPVPPPPGTTPVTDTDDLGTTIPMGTFSFPFYGTTHTGPENFMVSSNGLIEFSNTPNADNTPSGSEAETNPPGIAALWADFNPSIFADPGGGPAYDHGQVYMNTFNDDADPAIDRVVFTWDSALFVCSSSPTCHGTVQVQLLENGKIIFGYDGVLTNQAVDRCCFGAALMPFISKGGVVPPPGPPQEPPGTDFSQTVPFTGGDLIFELFGSNPVHFDLDQSNLVFTPTGADSYAVSSPVDVGVTSSGPSSGQTGGAATYTSTVTNNGSVAANGVALADTLPIGATLVSATASQGGCGGGGPVLCGIGTLAPGASATVTVNVTLNQAGDNVNRADASTSSAGDGQANNAAEVHTNVTQTTDTQPPGGAISVPKQSLDKALSKGVKVKVKCNEPCFAELDLATKLPKPKKKLTSVGKASLELDSAGSKQVKVKIDKDGRQRLKNAKKAKFELSVTRTDELGNSKTTKKKFKLK